MQAVPRLLKHRLLSASDTTAPAADVSMPPHIHVAATGDFYRHRACDYVRCFKTPSERRQRIIINDRSTRNNAMRGNVLRTAVARRAGRI